ncbi:DNA type IV secretion system protein ComB10 [Helicobacter sp. 11S03491-1]|uniref:DNA type IV secretion system protein ComB10 n=1 Tax=Helicobacter sp. 11S03491-1 TaxID=1476196 RepID=UPI000BCBBF20|nr:hypothetical protein BKH45_04325 [Helicobacter sp. 11S03491-1]
MILTWIKTHKIASFFLALLVGFFILLMIAKINKDDDDNEFENSIKYPIEDYLFQNDKEKKAREIRETQRNTQNAQNKNNQEDRDLQDEKNSFQVIEEKIKAIQKKMGLADTSNSNKGLIVLGNNKNNPNSLSRNPDGSINPNNKNAQFDYASASPANKARLALLAKRFSSASNSRSDNSLSGLDEINNPEIYAQANKEKEYGTDEFSNFDKKDIASNENKLLRTITADRMIPATLITPISSQIGGNKIVAQVESDIYASMGRAVLIPKGSRVIGFYNNNNKIGEYRLEVVWNRILTPQGVNIILSDAKGADVKGYAGLVGTLHNKIWERYGLPLTFSTLSNGLMLALSSTLNNKLNPNGGNFLQGYQTTQMLNSMRGDISNIIAQILREQVRIKPIITIREGSRIFISPNTDIFFPVPKNNEMVAEFFKEYKTINDEDMSDDENEF